MSDYKYDELFDELKKLESETNFKLVNSPTTTVGYTVVSKLNTVKHNHPMLSLDKTKSIDDMNKFINNKPILTMLKMDGLTISVKYSGGKLVSAETRGDGIEGEDVTHNALSFINLPHSIDYKRDLIIDGECIINHHDFNRINKPLIEKSKQEATEMGLTGKEYKEYVKKHSYANPRNLASGSVRQLDSEIAAQRHIQFVAWKVVSGYDNNSFSERLNWLETLGLTVVPRLDRFDERSINFLKIIADKYSYPIDGLVVSFDDVDYLESLGATSHHIRGQYAFKFDDEKETTILRDIEWNTSRSGLVNPIAIFDEVDINGSTISKATLHNLSYIKSLELGIGDEIEVYKANDVIPKVANNLTRSNSYKRPLLCKSCGAELEVHNENGSETLHCPNEECPARKLDKFIHFVSKDGMDIEGLSEATLEKFITNGWIRRFVDIYHLNRHKDEIVSLDGFGEKSWDKLWQNIMNSRNTTMSKFIYALGIPTIGKNTAKNIAKYTSIINPEKHASYFFGRIEFNTKDKTIFTPSICKNLQAYVADCKNRMNMTDLMSILNISQEQMITIDSPFTGKNIVITGTLNNYTRATIQTELERLGAKMGNSVSKNTDYLLTNEQSGSSKYKKAVELGIRIINEEEFEKMKG